MVIFADRIDPLTQGTDVTALAVDDYHPGDRVFIKLLEVPCTEVQLTLTKVTHTHLVGRISGYTPSDRAGDLPAALAVSTPHSCTRAQVQHHEYGG